MEMHLIIASVFACLLAIASAAVPIPKTIRDGVFPDNFNFGVSTSSYQVEGGWLDGGKGMSTWDAYSHIPGRIANNDTGDVANDMYHLYPSDIAIMKRNNIKHYRFSIAWNRIMPTGVAPVNPEAIAYYNDLINTLLENGVEPHVTIYHSETPLALTLYPNLPMPFMDSERFPNWFADYAEVLFANFGDRVKHWFTFNEPFCTAVFGTYGDVDPYLIAHNSILAHAETVKRYRSSYKPKQLGTIGIVLNTAHFYPADPSSGSDIESAKRGYAFWYGWFMDPFTKGEYPAIMRERVGKRLPEFTEQQRAMVKGSLDFVALNYYFPYINTPNYGMDPNAEGSFWKDMNVTSFFRPEWPLSQTGWGIYAPGLRDLILYTHKTYPGVPVYVTENGLAWKEHTIDEAKNDVMRQQYIHDHIEAVGEALALGSDVRGYFVWSFQDNLEWGSGYTMTFGLIYIDRTTPDLQRIEKGSLHWYSEAMKAFYTKNGR